MTSLIFWGPYLAHKSVISHKREKQRVKNYQRWEDLRDDYDEQRKLTRETRSLDIQRTGIWDGQQFTPAPGTQFAAEEPNHCVTLRDQQEANDARTGWRPQEAWDGPKTQVQAQMTGQVQQYQQPHTPTVQRHVSMTPAMIPQHTNSSTPALPLRSQKTGATWDEALPTRLAVSRQSFEDYDYSKRYRTTSTQSMPVSRDASLNRTSTASSQHEYFSPQNNTANQASRQDSISRTTSISRTQTPSGLRESTPAPAVATEVQDVSMPRVQRMYSPPEVQVTSVTELPKNEFGFVEPARIAAGGRMAELIERGY